MVSLNNVQGEAFCPKFSMYRSLETLQGPQWEELKNDFMYGTKMNRETASKIIIGTLEPMMFNSLHNLNLRLSTDMSDIYQRMIIEIMYRIPTMDPYGEPYGYFKKFFDGIVMSYNRGGQSVYQINHYGRISQINYSFSNDGSLDNNDQLDSQEGKLAEEINAAITYENFEDSILDDILIAQLKANLGPKQFTKLLEYVSTDEGYKRLSTLFNIINKGENAEKRAASIKNVINNRYNGR